MTLQWLDFYQCNFSPKLNEINLSLESLIKIFSKGIPNTIFKKNAYWGEGHTMINGIQEPWREYQYHPLQRHYSASQAVPSHSVPTSIPCFLFLRPFIVVLGTFISLYHACLFTSRILTHPTDFNISTISSRTLPLNCQVHPLLHAQSTVSCGWLLPCPFPS